MASKGQFTDFENALRAFESGVTPDTIASGWAIDNQVITQADLDRYNSHAISLRELQYTSVNFLGFIGYQVGEALLIDLHYYQDSFYYGNGAAKNTWGADGSGGFLGKDGIGSLAALKTGLQESVMLAEFGLNLHYLDSFFADAGDGHTIEEYLGTTRGYTDTTTGKQVTVSYSLSGILAAAHLRGADGVFQLMHNGVVSSDETGTSIITYLTKFGGYDTPGKAVLAAAWSGNATLKLSEEIWQSDFNRDGKIGTVPVGGGQTFAGHPADEIFTGNAGNADTVDYSSASGGVAANLTVAAAQAVGGGQGLDRFVSIENLTGSAFNDRLTGNAAINALKGAAGNDVLDGKGGADAMTGGTGNDVYRVDNALDKAIEVAGQGADTVLTTVSYTLTAGSDINILKTANHAVASALSLTGNALAQTIQGNAGSNAIDGGGGNDVLAGNAGNDRLAGAAGKDVLSGGAGTDTLAGGSGHDSFFFNSAGGNDRILDFVVADDTVRMSKAVFKGLAGGVLIGGAFHEGSAAADGADRIIYNADTGALSFDRDGTGDAQAIQFAILAAHLALGNADFLIV